MVAPQQVNMDDGNTLVGSIAGSNPLNTDNTILINGVDDDKRTIITLLYLNERENRPFGFGDKLCLHYYKQPTSFLVTKYFI